MSSRTARHNREGQLFNTKPVHGHSNELVFETRPCNLTTRLGDRGNDSVFRDSEVGSLWAKCSSVNA